MKRRDFLKTSAAITTGVSALPLNATATHTEPLKAELKVRVLQLRPSSDGGLIIISDGSPHPRKLVRSEVIDDRFGKGTSQTLLQPDHWCMIDAGWFGEKELYQPADIDDPAFRIWHANYKPEVKAHEVYPFSLILPN